MTFGREFLVKVTICRLLYVWAIYIVDHLRSLKTDIRRVYSLPKTGGIKVLALFEVLKYVFPTSTTSSSAMILEYLYFYFTVFSFLSRTRSRILTFKIMWKTLPLLEL